MPRALDDVEVAADRSRLRGVVDRLLQPVALVAPDSTLLYINPAGAHVLGQEPAWLEGRRMLDLVHPADRSRIDQQLQRLVTGRPAAGIGSYRLRATADRGWRLLESTANNLLDDPAVAGILVSSRDITEAALRDRQLRDAAFTDPVTGLPNLASFSRTLEIREPGAPLAVVYIGLDDFAGVTESLGHEASRAILHAVGARIAAAVPSAVAVTRVGGEVFAVLLQTSEVAAPAAVAWRVLDRISEPLWSNGQELQLTASAGTSHEDVGSARQLLIGDAALAFAHARRGGRGSVEPYVPDLRAAATRRRELEVSLRRALVESRLQLARQPIVRLSDRSVVGGEALLRWDLDGSAVPPDEFIPIAEESALIVQLGDWVLEHAPGLVDPAVARININLSARQLSSPGLVRSIARMLRASRLRPDTFGFEVTETLLVERFDYATEVLRAIRELGCRVGLDDFGTGYSSLCYLRRLPLDFLKIDASLTADVATDGRARAVLEAITTMSDALGLDTVAEGIEDDEQAVALEEVGVVYGQGFLFGRPEVPHRANAPGGPP